MGEIVYIMPFCFNFIKWVRDNLFNPLIEFIVDLAMKAIIPFIGAVIDAIYKAIIGFIFSVYILALKILDMLQDIFGYLSGTEQVSYISNGTKGTGYLTDVLANMPYITNAFWLVWLISVILCGIFLIAAVIRSIGSLDENGRTINDVLKSAAKTFVMFAVIQITMYGVICFSSIIIGSVSNALNLTVGSETDVRFSNAIFAVSIINAIPSDDAEKNEKSLIDELTKGGMLTSRELEKNWNTCMEFYRGDKLYWDVTDYTKSESGIPLVITKIDYLSGILCIIFVLKYLVGAALAFVQRIIVVITLFITAPFFIALSPLDDGDRFRQWKDAFIGNCLSTIGVILSARIFLLILPMFLADGFIYEGTGILSYIIRILSVILLCLAFDGVGEIFNKIMSDANIMGSAKSFETAFGTIMDLKETYNTIKATAKGKRR